MLQCGTTNEQLKIELLSQWKLEAEFRNSSSVTTSTNYQDLGIYPDFSLLCKFNSTMRWKRTEFELVCHKQQLNVQIIHKQICSLELSIMHLFWSLARSPVANWCFTLSPVPTVDDKSSLLAATGQNNSHRIVDSGPLYTN